MKSSNDVLFSVALITTVLSCGLMLPIWLLAGLIYLIVTLFEPPIEPKSMPKTIFPSNDFASDWEFIIRDI